MHDLSAGDGRVVTLRWTATGDDGGTGQAALYDIRYSSGPISAANWDSATAVASPLAPASAGQQELWSVPGLA